MIFKKATISDLEEMQQLYVQTIQAVCKIDYNEEQRKVWSSGVNNTERWLEVIKTQFVLLAINRKSNCRFRNFKRRKLYRFLLHSQRFSTTRNCR